MSCLAADCFAAAGRLQFTSFHTNLVDLKDALLVSIHNWKDAVERIVHLRPSGNGPPFLGVHARFSHYITFCSNEEARLQPIMGLGVEGHSQLLTTNTVFAQTCRIKYLGI